MLCVLSHLHLPAPIAKPTSINTITSPNFLTKAQLFEHHPYLQIIVAKLPILLCPCT